MSKQPPKCPNCGELIEVHEIDLGVQIMKKWKNAYNIVCKKCMKAWRVESDKLTEIEVKL